MDKLDWKKTHKTLYAPPASPVVVDVPPLNFLMIDGQGDPNNNPVYANALEALFSLAYTLKFAIKKASGVDFAVFPAEGLWWTEDMADFTTLDKSNWQWTMMIAQPKIVTVDEVEQARAAALKKKGQPDIARVRFERYAEGRAAQLMHSGPFSAEGPNIQRLHAFIQAQGGILTGKHHEIYLSDFRRTAPEKLKTVIRQPFSED